MSLNEIMKSLQEDAANPKRPPQPPKRGIREQLALVLMKAERQVSCLNCTRRRMPCRIYTRCKEDGAFAFFDPKPSLMTLQLGRVNALMDALDNVLNQKYPVY